ncbi:hypothetical protein A2U01_0087724, partial [Trifolium medium]|nr:hypothetical protein [Trifolium medium]
MLMVKEGLANNNLLKGNKNNKESY